VETHGELADVCRPSVSHGIFTACGRKVRIVMGSTKNIKITTPPDLATANAFLAEKA
jgi:2-C-methyl-D-erythritol 4-phosphate cytidylyltransferase